MANNVVQRSATVLETPVIGAGHDFATVTETVSQIPLSSRTPLPWVAIFLTALGLFAPHLLHLP